MPISGHNKSATVPRPAAPAPSPAPLQGFCALTHAPT